MSSAVTLIRSSSLSDRAEYAYAATAPAGARLIFLAGSCPLNRDGTTAAIRRRVSQGAMGTRTHASRNAEKRVTGHCLRARRRASV